MNWIEDVYHRGIDTGCGGSNFCPTSLVTRALMAQMVARTWAYQMPWTAPNTASDTYTYTFNAANQLTAVQFPSGNLTFTYDGDGQRFSKSGSRTIPGGGIIIDLLYVRDPQGRVIAEYSSTPALLAEYVYLDGERLCKITHDAGGAEHRVYYHADVLGTPVAETNELGQLITRAEYYPFGDEVTPGAATDPHKFTGKELDDEIGLYYFGARYYDAHLGRFISVDPVAGKNADPQSWNRYAYARNNPLRFVDPNGLEDVLIFKTEGKPLERPDPWGAAATLAASEYKVKFKGRYESLNVKIFDVSRVDQVDEALKNARDIVAIDFIGHSTPDLLAIGSASAPGTNISARGGPDDVSPFSLDWSNIKKDPGSQYQIRLLGCRPGSGVSPVAQDIATASGVGVLAPTARINFTEGGAPYVEWYREPNEWRVFTPAGPITDR